ncbi:MAG: M20/M25/M40 family metallo-hydrolase, partial [Chloroflexota bacterium]
LIGCLSAAHHSVRGEKPVLRGVTYGSDMRLFINHAHIAATHYGPGDAHLAHAVNESVEVDEVLTATRVIALLITNWCGGNFLE